MLKDIRSETIEELVQRAREAYENAYAPYSHFKVGAALLGKSGTIHTGCNVENASYGLTICAERNAVAKAVSSGEREFSALAIFTGADHPTPPCGACRQVIAEFSEDMPVIMETLQSKRVILSLKDLLPHRFQF
ncbi:cytidine deaminase [Candidatus Sumerlaeota bacterium]|nr:cytidine deaminase [Candidatus Sumerlaeota bacterium]